MLCLCHHTTAAFPYHMTSLNDPGPRHSFVNKNGPEYACLFTCAWFKGIDTMQLYLLVLWNCFQVTDFWCHVAISVNILFWSLLALMKNIIWVIRTSWQCPFLCLKISEAVSNFKLYSYFKLLQPQNLLLTGAYPDCDIKLCDFGISRFIQSGVEVREILGTPDYVGMLYDQ